MRETSINAYHTIKNNGLLSKRRWQVYDYIFHNGPVTCRETVKAIASRIGQGVSVTYSSYSSRFSELLRLGVIKEVGKVLDEETNNTVILWDVTERLPIKLPKVKTKDQIIKELTEENSKLKAQLGLTNETKNA